MTETPSRINHLSGNNIREEPSEDDDQFFAGNADGSSAEEEEDEAEATEEEADGKPPHFPRLSEDFLSGREQVKLNVLLRRYVDWIESKEEPPVCPNAKWKAIRRNHYAMLYHSNAIEGNSFSYAETKNWLIYGQLIPGKTLKEHYEVLGLKSAFGFLNGLLLDKSEPALTLEVLQAIHKRVLHLVDSAEAGTFRCHRVEVGDYVPPYWGNVPALMAQFVEDMKSLANGSAHPMICAAWAHFALANIHPWADGNGRTSRLVMNFWLMQAGFPPVIIAVGTRRKYFQALKTADQGNLVPFVRFIVAQTKRTVHSILHSSGSFQRAIARHLPCHYLCCAFAQSGHQRHLFELPFEGMQREVASAIGAVTDFVQAEVCPSFGPNGTRPRPDYAAKLGEEGEDGTGTPPLLKILLGSVRLQEGDFRGTILILASALLEQAELLLDMGFQLGQLGPAFSAAFERMEKEILQGVLAKLRRSNPLVDVDNDQLPGAGSIEMQMAHHLKALSEDGEELRALHGVKEGEDEDLLQDAHANMLQQLALVCLANALQAFPALLAENTNENARKVKKEETGFRKGQPGKWLLLQLAKNRELLGEGGWHNWGVDMEEVATLVPVGHTDRLEAKRNAWTLTGRALEACFEALARAAWEEE